MRPKAEGTALMHAGPKGKSLMKSKLSALTKQTNIRSDKVSLTFPLKS